MGEQYWYEDRNAPMTRAEKKIQKKLDNQPYQHLSQR